MHCFSCNCQLGDKAFRDSPTKRFYCETCREIIWNTIDNMGSRDDDYEEDLNLIVKNLDDVPVEDVLQGVNLPVDDYYE